MVHAEVEEKQEEGKGMVKVIINKNVRKGGKEYARI